MSSLKTKTINGVIWSAIDNISGQGITFLLGIILARLLTPAAFGLIGMVTIFISISQAFVDSGFGSALIRKKACTEIDYSTVFFYNLAVGIIVYFVLFIAAPLISTFFKEPQLTKIVRILGFSLIINSLTIIQRITLVKRVDFKLQTKISVISVIISGIVGIGMAYSEFGVWSLVFQSLSKQLLNSVLLWFWNRWHPMWVFSIKSFKELFSFGSKMLASGLINTVYQNIYYIIIGKYFSTKQLGFYTRAEQFNEPISANLYGIMYRVTFPVMAQMQDEPERLKATYKRIIIITMLISMLIMAGVAAVAEPMIITLIGEKWRQSIVYLQLLTFVGMMYPLQALNLNMLQVQGRSDILLRLEIIKKIIAIPMLVIGIFWGIKVLILGMWITALISYGFNSYWSGRLINYSVSEQIADIIPGFLIAITMGIVVWVIGWILPFSYLVKLIVQIFIGIIISILLCELLKPGGYVELKYIFRHNIITLALRQRNA